MLTHFLGTDPLLESTHLSVSYKKPPKNPKNKKQQKKKTRKRKEKTNLKNPLPSRECRFCMCL